MGAVEGAGPDDARPGGAAGGQLSRGAEEPDHVPRHRVPADDAVHQLRRRRGDDDHQGRQADEGHGAGGDAGRRELRGADRREGRARTRCWRCASLGGRAAWQADGEPAAAPRSSCSMCPAGDASTAPAAAESRWRRRGTAAAAAPASPPAGRRAEGLESTVAFKRKRAGDPTRRRRGAERR